MSDSMSYHRALQDCAIECALRRKNRRCRVSFDAPACQGCKWYIGNYSDASPAHLQLYMTQAELQAGAIKATSGGHHLVFAILVAIFLTLGILGYRDFKAADALIAQKMVQVRPVAQTKAVPVTQPSSPRPAAVNNVRAMIDSTLKLVSRDLNNKVDINHDGIINCVDAAVLFYQHFPDKSKVQITLNKNDATKMHHLFNVVLIDEVWRAIEPQATWANKSSFYMTDVWSNQYDSRLNQNVTQHYIQYIK